MENSLKNKVKVLGGALLLGLTVVGSAFTTENRDNKPVVEKETTQQQHRFFNISGNPSSTNPLDYVYDSSGDCRESEKACSAEWTHTGTPTNGMHPNGAKVSADDLGTYIPSN